MTLHDIVTLSDRSHRSSSFRMTPDLQKRASMNPLEHAADG
jgi:hypothetical protein